MTEANNDRRKRYTAVEDQTVFPIDFPVGDVDYLRVYVSDTEALDPLLYTVDLEEMNIILDTGAEAGDIVVIEGLRVIERMTDFPLRGGLRTSKLNSELDGMMQIMQEMRRDVDRCMNLNKAEGDNISNFLPLQEEGRMLLWGEAGLVNGADADEIINAQYYAEEALDNAVAAASSALAAQSARSAAEAAASGMKWRPSVRVCTTANIVLSGLQTVNGVALAGGDLVLVMNQATQSQNGVYTVAAGAWSRSGDADNWAELVGQVRVVEEGTSDSDNLFICTVNAGGTLGSTAVTWATLPVAIIDGSLTVQKFNSSVYASTLQAETGTENTLIMTALRVKEAIAKFLTGLALGGVANNRSVSFFGLFIVKYGYDATAIAPGTAVTTAFNAAFPNNCFWAAPVGYDSNSANLVRPMNVQGFDVNGLQIGNPASNLGGSGRYWIAFGN